LNPRPFEYHSPRTVDEALAFADRYGPDGKYLAGGQSLIPLMKLRIASPAHIIDLGRIDSLSYIKADGDQIAIGAMTRLNDLSSSGLVAEECPALAQCAVQIADPLVRNLSTLGGNIAHADPSNDMPAVMVATGAQLIATSSRGRRPIPATDFFVDTFTTALRQGELLTEIRIPMGRCRLSAYVKLERQPGDFGVVGVAAVVELASDGTCSSCGVALSGVGPKVLKAKRSEGLVVGKRLDEGTLERAGRAAAEDCDPVGDLRGSAEYKRRMAQVMTIRALRAAAKEGERI
jgi:aerobic carbon-monoxide dehydrogenase medium subunit